MNSMNLKRAVDIGLGFLDTKFGYNQIIKSEYHIQLESSKLIIDVFYEKRSHEIGIEFSLKGDSFNGIQRSYSHGSFLRFIDDKNAQKYSFFQSSVQSEVEEFLSYVGSKLRTKGKDLVSGDSNFFDSFSEFNALESKEYYKESVLRSRHAVASKAWEEKNYKKYATIMSDIESFLSESEKKKLSFAKKKAGII